MAIYNDPIDFQSLYGTDGLGAYAGVRDNTTDLAARQNAVNDAYVELAQIKGYWRLRSFDYTSSSSPALTDGTYQYALPTSAAATFDSAFRLYYRLSGRTRDVTFVDDAEWLERSMTSNFKGYPRYVRIFQTASQKQIELSPVPSSTFISQAVTLTLEYFIQVVRLSASTDQPILPANLRHHIIPVAAYKYAIQQGDQVLITSLTRPQGRMRLSMVDNAFAEVLKHDLTRTGRPRQLRPSYSYLKRSGGSRDYGDQD